MKTYQFEVVAHAIVAFECDTEDEAWELMGSTPLDEILLSEAEYNLIDVEEN